MSLGFCLEELSRHLRDHRGPASAAVATMALAFLLLGLFLLLWVNVRAMTGQATEELRLQVFLRDEIEAAQRDRVRTALEREPAVESVSYVSKEEALARFTAQGGEQAALLEGLGTNPLPAAFDVRLRPDPALTADLPALAGRIEAEAGVELVRYGQEWIGRFRVVLAFLRALGIGVGGVVAAAVVAIVANTIRFLIDARRQDIAVLKIVGASPGVIALPYLLEGVLLGAAGALLALGGLAGLMAWSGPALETAGGFLLGRGGLQFLPPQIMAAVLSAGALLGAIGSALALRRHFGLTTAA
ncbi:MAG: permease-like cell division protein FtsX [Nitrospirota bacterium]